MSSTDCVFCEIAAGRAPASIVYQDQTDQESRSAGHGAAASLTVMDITIHMTGEALLRATPTESPTGRNLAATQMETR